MISAFLAFTDLLGNSEKDDVFVNRMLKLLGYELFWGPSMETPGKYRPTNALIFIACNKDEYIVSIRGTNPFSVYSWVKEDFEIRKLIPWKKCILPTDLNKKTEISPKIKVSQATANAIKIHTQLSDSQGNSIIKTFKEIIADKTRSRIVFTGHSLGGLLAPTLGVWLKDSFTRDIIDSNKKIAVYAMAGPTAGNKQFAEHSLKQLDFLKNYRNRNDVAVNVWNRKSIRKIPKIYKQYFKQNLLLKLVLFIVRISIFRKHYTILKTIEDEYIPSQLIETRSFILQVAFQHVVPYLMSIVDKILTLEDSSKEETIVKALFSELIHTLPEFNMGNENINEFLTLLKNKKSAIKTDI